MQEDYVLELEHIRKEYPGVVALKDVTLQLRRGEVLGLIGENGAGKSTLIKCCSGAVIPTSGKIKINGKEFDRMTPQLAAENGIAIIYQEFNNVGELSAAENLFLGRPIRKGIVIDRKAMEEEAAKAFEQLRIKINPRELVKNLSVGYQQMIEIAKAIQQNAQVLIMDEPSAPLTTNEVESMFRVVELLREKYVKTLITPQATVDELIQLMVGREMTQKYPPRKPCIKDEVVLELKHVYGNGDKDISLQLHAGEVLGLGGLVGAGRTELAEVLFREYGFDGLIMTDWVVGGDMLLMKGSKYGTPDAAKVAAAGCSLFMPGYKGDYDQIIKGLSKGTVSVQQLRENAGRIMHVLNRLGKE